MVRKAIFLFRNGVGNLVQIEDLLDVPARTLRRYVEQSKDPSCKLFYQPETGHERRGRLLMEAGRRHGVFSAQSLEAAVQYARPKLSVPESAAAAAAPSVPAPHADFGLQDLPEPTSQPRLESRNSLGLPSFDDESAAEPASAANNAGVLPSDLDFSVFDAPSADSLSFALSPLDADDFSLPGSESMSMLDEIAALPVPDLGFSPFSLDSLDMPAAESNGDLQTSLPTPLPELQW